MLSESNICKMVTEQIINSNMLNNNQKMQIIDDVISGIISITVETLDDIKGA